MITGRKSQQKILEELLTIEKSSFVAVTGRRRIGKTYLIDTFYKKQITFRLTGIQNANKKEQLINFTETLNQYSKHQLIKPITSWQEAFIYLKNFLQTLDSKKKKVIFIDELPWISTFKSNFIQFLAHFWNDYLSKEKNFILIVCGSSTSWLTKKIINDKGGLHNRLTTVINLKPFTLKETKDFFKTRKLNLNNTEIAKIYMSFGGVPYYLEQINKGESATMAIERLCFAENGLLKNEYNNLYKALFKNAENYETIIEHLAKSKQGLTAKELIGKTKLSTATFSRTLNDLLLTNFISEHIPYERKKRGSLYRLNDEYSLFFHRFIKQNKQYSKGIWTQIANNQNYKIWTGYAFENLCFKHLPNIKKTLGISGIYTRNYSFQVKTDATTNQKGFQIDLIIDRNDNTINLCEIKFYNAKFKIDKNYAETLRERKQNFIELTKTKKQVFTTFITNYGVKKNSYGLEIVDSEIILDDLFN